MPTKNLFKRGNALLGIVGVVFALAVLGAGFFLANKKYGSFILSSSASADSAVLTLSPATLTMKPNDSQTIGVTINSQTNSVSAVELALNFNPSIVAIDAITPGPFFPSPLTLSPLKVTGGKATIVLGNTPSSQTKGIKGNSILASIRFHALAPGSFSFTTTGSRIASISKTDNVYESGGTSAVTVSTSGSTIPTPVAFWKFDETSGSVVSDSSGNNSHGTATGTRIDQGKIGNARSFNGSSSFVTVPDSNNLDITGGITISAWIYPTALPNFNTIISKRGTAVNYILRLQGNRLNFVYKDSTGGWQAFSNPATTFTTNTWYHVAFTYDGASARFYTNGNLVGSPIPCTWSPKCGLIADTNQVAIGYNYPGSGVEVFNGKIDEIRLYKVVLSPTEISDLYNSAQ